MSREEQSHNLLSSWKDIAIYLGCDVRTSRRWEESLGLPVHRLEGSPRSRVFAYRDELDAWIKKRNSAMSGRPTGYMKPAFFSSKLAVRLGALAFVAALILIYIYFWRPGPASPFRLEIQRSELILFDKRGTELWRKDTGFENLQSNAFYQERFQRKAPSEVSRLNSLPACFIRDINGDGHPEILISIQTVGQTSPLLICYSHEGKELWRFRGGKEMKFGSTTYYGDYWIKGFDIHDFDRDGQVEVFVLSFHRPDWPTQLVLLSSQGRKLGEYWNVGQLNDYLVMDIDDDGQEELILVGLNNEYRKGCLIAFQPARISGGSPQTKDEFINPELGPGSELFYVLFPRTDADLVQTAMEYESIASIRQVNSKVLRLDTFASDIYFYLNLSFVAQDVSLSHGFKRLHNEAKQKGQISSILNEDYKKRLLEGLLYFDGRSWTAKPSPRRPYDSGRARE